MLSCGQSIIVQRKGAEERGKYAYMNIVIHFHCSSHIFRVYNFHTSYIEKCSENCSGKTLGECNRSECIPIIVAIQRFARVGLDKRLRNHKTVINCNPATSDDLLLFD